MQPTFDVLCGDAYATLCALARTALQETEP